MTATDAAFDTFGEVASTFGGPGPPPPPPATLTDLREYVAALLDGVVEDAETHPGPVDSVTPPAYMVVWPGPGVEWLTPVTVCNWNVRAEVVCVGARIDPQPGYEQLEQLVAAAVVAFDAAAIPVTSVTPPVPQEIGGVQYLTCRLAIVYPITFEGASSA
jgi:hypothetical protein